MDCPAGIGGSLSYEKRLDAEISSILMGLNSIKSCEIGLGGDFSYIWGYHQDELYYDNEKKICLSQ